MIYSLICFHSEKVDLLAQEGYSKFRLFFLNPILVANLKLEFEKLLPEFYLDWIPEFKIKFEQLLLNKLPEINYSFTTDIWKVFIRTPEKNSILASWRYINYEYKIIESRTYSQVNMEYYNIYETT